MPVDVLVGLQWGDEGKGKIVDLLSSKYDIVARYQGGPNAGHTLVIGDRKFVLHTVPSGIIQENTLNVIGNGLVIDPIVLKKELATLNESGIDAAKRLLLSDKAHLILPTHKALDAAYESAKGEQKIGSTLKGIGPTYMDKTAREGMRIGSILEADFDLQYKQLKERHLRILEFYKIEPQINEDEWFAALETLRSLKITGTELYLNQAIVEGKSIMAEGAQGTLLDIDFGTYPYVTSSNTTAAGACTGLGIAPKHINDVIGIFKAYVTRVGGGPFPTELTDETGRQIQKDGNEFGSTTGRARRCGWLDIPALRHAILLNGVTKLAMMKIDVLSSLDKIEVASRYRNGEEGFLPAATKNDYEYAHFEGWLSDVTNTTEYDALPRQLTDYLQFIEEATDKRIDIISTGPKRGQTITR